MQISHAPLIDTHTHLYSAEFATERVEVVQRAVAAGVYNMLLPNIDANSIEALHQMLTDFPAHCRGMMGLHPCAVHQDYKKSLHAIENQLSLFKGYVGVGEIGLDYYWDTQWKDCQKHAFATQLDWAKNLGLPVSIHSRESFDDALALLAQAQDGRLSGVFHCFGGELTQAMKIIDQGFMLGIGGVSTYKNASHSRVLPFVDMSRIVLETDSPYLSPQPKRGKVNESAFLPYVAQHLATIYKTDYDTIASITTQNAIQLFKL